jgi:hypothetical protein
VSDSVKKIQAEIIKEHNIVKIDKKLKEMEIGDIFAFQRSERSE